MKQQTYNCNDLYDSEHYREIRVNNVKKLDVSSLPEVPHYEKGSSDSVIQSPAADRSILRHRYIVAVLEFFVFFEISTYRLATSVSVVAMVNSSAIHTQTFNNISTGSCPLNFSSEDKHLLSNKIGDFDWNPVEQGCILGANFLGYVITQMPGGMLAQSYGAKPTILCGLIISSVAHLFSPLAAWSGSYVMVGVQLLRGIGQGLLPAAHCVISASWFPSTERGLLNAVILTGYPVGALVSALSSGYMCSSSFLGGWPSVYYIFGGLGLVLCLCFQLFLYESPSCHPSITNTELTYILQNQENVFSQKRPPTPWKEIFTSCPVYALTYAMFGAFWAGSHFITVQPVYLDTILHFSIHENSIITSIPFIFQTALAFIGSWIAQCLNRRDIGVDKVRKGFNLLYCFGYSLCLVGVFYTGCDRVWSAVLSVAAMGTMGFSFNGCMITANDMTPTFAGTLMGLTSTVGSTAAFIFPVIVGVMTNGKQTLEQWNKIFMICNGIVLSSGIIFFIFGSAEVQKWNYPSVTEEGKVCPPVDKDKKDLRAETFQADITIHL
ncbi:putative inorganic phosphate cotransporter [Caerostris darwini]|uniref:Inorganic phosphate cotransporter n=1 Tax=Caerostris darwini TaxID=1538125 RepID=A0AAV4WHH2_9ARAC|nr:putative inorganic phosphate cotransporter [Caerostris darwini]